MKKKNIKWIEGCGHPINGTKSQKIDRLIVLLEAIKADKDSEYFVELISPVGATIGGEFMTSTLIFAKVQFDVYFEKFVKHIKSVEGITQKEIDELIELAQNEIVKELKGKGD